MRCFIYFLVLCFAVSMNTHAQTAKKAKSKTYLKLVEAYTQRTRPGRPESAPPPTGTHFIIVWEYAKYPETFFWRGEGGWLSCNMLKAHKITNKSRNMPKGIDYRTEFVTGDQVHKGDTLQLTPVTGGKFPIPDEIPKDAKNTLFFKTGGSGWLSFLVENITKKPDILMP